MLKMCSAWRVMRSSNEKDKEQSHVARQSIQQMVSAPYQEFPPINRAVLGRLHTGSSWSEPARDIAIKCRLERLPWGWQPKHVLLHGIFRLQASDRVRGRLTKYLPTLTRAAELKSENQDSFPRFTPPVHTAPQTRPTLFAAGSPQRALRRRFSKNPVQSFPQPRTL